MDILFQHLAAYCGDSAIGKHIDRDHHGLFNRYIKRLDTGYVKYRSELFLSVSLVVSGMGNIENSLKQ